MNPQRPHLSKVKWANIRNKQNTFTQPRKKGEEEEEKIDEEKALANIKDKGEKKKSKMKFQRRILPPHSPTYLEMEEYATPSSSRQSSK